MSLNKGKHVIKEIEGIRCTIIETGASKDRMSFLSGLLEHNGFEVKIQEEEKKPPPPPPATKEGEDPVAVHTEPHEEPTTFTIGVTDIVFNPVIQVYERKLRTKDGYRVTPDYWNQKTDKTEPNYWDMGKKGQ